MYWSASREIWVSISSSPTDDGIEITLVITADPATATAACFDLVPERLTARRIASPTASTSAMLFSTTEFAGRGSTV
jgi:hypothetical protein